MPKYGQPVISRETRLLLITIVVSVGALWLLARLRFQDRPVTAVPVAPVLAQLRPQSSYDDLARSLSNLRPGVSAVLAAAENGTAALRIGDEVGIGVTDTGFEFLRIPQGDVPLVTAWTPRFFDYPRYLVAADLVDGAVSLRPIFVGSLTPIESATWQGSIWRLPPGLTLSPGTFVFSTDGLLAGAAVEHTGSLALVPGRLVLEEAGRLGLKVPHDPAYLGITVQPTPLGLAIAWVDPSGPAADDLAATDLIQSLNGQPITSEDDWHARVRNIAKGDEVKLQIRSEGEKREVAIVAAAVVEPPEDESLGLRMRAVPRVGVDVIGVDPRSRADRAGIKPGDVITVFGPLRTPTPVQVTRTFEALPAKERLLVAVTRGDSHHIVVVGKNAR